MPIGTHNVYSMNIYMYLKLTYVLIFNLKESSDDDKIAQYKWEEVKGPLNEKNKMISSGADSPVLQLKSLVPGIYTFKYVTVIFIITLYWMAML
jgi:hypothetical protein